MCSSLGTLGAQLSTSCPFYSPVGRVIKAVTGKRNGEGSIPYPRCGLATFTHDKKTKGVEKAPAGGDPSLTLSPSSVHLSDPVV